MDMDQIQCALAVAEYGSFTEASFQLSLSQSSISKKIAALEKELDIRLFDRSTRTVSLTPAGEIFIRYGVEIQRQHSLMLNNLLSCRPSDRDRLVVGSIYFAPSQSIAPRIAQFARIHPGVEIETVYGTTNPLVKALLAGKIDIAVVSSMYPSDKTATPSNFGKDTRFISASLALDPYFLVVSTRHPLADRKFVDYQDIRHEKLITLDGNMDVYHNAINRLFEEEGIKPEVVVKSGSIQEALLLVSENVGVALFSLRAASGSEGVRFIEMRRPLLRDTQLLMRNGETSDSIRLFYEFMKNNYR